MTLALSPPHGNPRPCPDWHGIVIRADEVAARLNLASTAAAIIWVATNCSDAREWQPGVWHRDGVADVVADVAILRRSRA